MVRAPVVPNRRFAVTEMGGNLSSSNTLMPAHVPETYGCRGGVSI